MAIVVVRAALRVSIFLFVVALIKARIRTCLVSVAVLISDHAVIDLDLGVIGPVFSGPSVSHQLDGLLRLPLGIGGVWLAMFARELQKRPLMAFNDPQMESVSWNRRTSITVQQFVEES